MSVIGVFPGQGAQCVGMLRHSLSLPSVQSLCKLASDTLGYDIAAICTSGPQEKLNQTSFCQPATLLASLCAYERYSHSRSAVPSAVAGFSVGEISALVVSGAVSYRDAFLFVKQRAEAMQYASVARASGMLSVSGASVAVVQSVLEEFGMEKPVELSAVIANYLSENTCSVSVAEIFASELSGKLTAAGARSVKRIPVSGGFHSHFMAPATERIKEAVEKVHISLPSIPTYSNLTALPYASVEEIRHSLVFQTTQPVQWHGIMKRLLQCCENPEVVEFGYGNQLLSILARIDRKAYKLATPVTP